MAKSKSIYTVTTLRNVDPNSEDGLGCRTVAWFSKLKDAKQCIEQNWGDICEDKYYPYAVIEEVEEGLYSANLNTWWYKWEGSVKDGSYKFIKKPDSLEHVINFSID